MERGQKDAETWTTVMPVLRGESCKLDWCQQQAHDFGSDVQTRINVHIGELFWDLLAERKNLHIPFKQHLKQVPREKSIFFFSHSSAQTHDENILE